MDVKDTDLDSMIITFNTAVTETASEILGKHHQKKKPWVTAEILDLYSKTGELRKKRFEPEGPEKYKEVNNPMDPVLSHHTSQERQPAAVPELQNNQPHQSPKQSRAEDHTEQTDATSRDDHR